MVFNLSDPLHTTNFFHIQYLIEKKLAHISFTLKIDFIELCEGLSTNSFFYQKLKLIEIRNFNHKCISYNGIFIVILINIALQLTQVLAIIRSYIFLNILSKNN